ncbi:Decarbamoylnovobiocin carbamoyltransferase [Rubripirellula obstinata]|uniref:Decarbamoylnovobiocin carbamoyltransferase n=1 Tax=Rubripirellula obstinata TaxID=406547 RepID=A0A5B1CIT0_9BACT|nr:carbamoyltransferase C-terminal domain-containing protein [Rubripirellula obstinata]KAA1261008.1 Decarbamoylnovobiocin carbamoyltransferase [Rubripirellula obstinata]
MKVLGISPLDKDVTASFVEDGKILFACGEERLSRVKLQDGFPMRAIRLGLQRTGWSLDEIDTVAYSFFDGDREHELMRAAMQEDETFHRDNATAESLAKLKQVRRAYKAIPKDPIPGLDASDEFAPRKSFAKRALYELAGWSPSMDRRLHRKCFRQWVALATADHQIRTQQLHAGLDELGLRDKLQRFNHHLCHAANAYYYSGYESALAMSFDGYGSGNCGAVYEATPTGLVKLHEFRFPNSLGQFYEYVTSALGFRPGRHEGKIVGLAAYGDPEVLGDVLRERFTGMEQGDIRMRAATNYHFARLLSQNFSKRDMAAAFQTVLEEVVQQVADYWVNKTGLRNVCLSGGVNANVKLNQRIHECDGVDSVFVYPNMGDGGCGTGAALLALPSECRPKTALRHAYLGPNYSSDEIRAALDEEKLAYEEHADVEPAIADLLVNKRIVARFNGSMEYGPRALGNRSILYPAQDPEVNLWLNHQLGRTEFMPFAPAALAEEASRLFKNMQGCEKTAQFMTVTFDCTDDMKRMCPAAVHIDGTARPQLVSAETNESFYRILKSYFEKSGIPSVINTSFNMHEEPIVCSPQDAVRAFLDGRIDYLAIGPFIVPHPKLIEIESERRSDTAAASV